MKRKLLNKKTGNETIFLAKLICQFVQINVED